TNEYYTRSLHDALPILKNNFKYRDKIDYLPQIANFPGNLKVSELIEMIKDLRATKATHDEDLIDLFKLQPFLNKRLVNLSGGTKDRKSTRLNSSHVKIS